MAAAGIVRAFVPLNLLLVLLFASINDTEGQTTTPSTSSIDMVGFAYYTKDNPTRPVERTTLPQKLASDDGTSALAQSDRTVFYVHGWKGDMRDSRAVKDAIFAKRPDVQTVVLVDWELLSQGNVFADLKQVAKGIVLDYTWAASKKVPQVATALYEELTWLHDNGKMQPAATEVAGHSLGAPIAAQAGKLWNDKGVGKIDVVIGLDPPAKYYEDHPDLTLNPADADYVEVIHTSPSLGYYKNMGHKDIYVDPADLHALSSCDSKSSLTWEKDRCQHSAARDYYKNDPRSHKNNPMKPDELKPRPQLPKGRKGQGQGQGATVSINMLVLDVSPSMHDEGGGDRIRSLVTSSRRVVQSAQIGSFLGVVIFGGNAQVTQSPVNVSDDHVRNSIMASLPTIHSKIDYTSIGAGLLAAVGALKPLKTKFPNSCPNIILMTDGQNNWHPDIAAAQPKVAELCAKVNSVALGSDADSGLEWLSSTTKGKAFSVSDLSGNTAGKLTQSLLDAVDADLDPEDRAVSLPPKTVKVDGSNPTTATFLLDQGVGKNTQFFVTSPNFDLDSLRAELVGPDQKTYGSADPQFERDKETQRIGFNFPEALPGKWTMNLSTVNSTSTSGRRRRKRGTAVEPQAIISVTTYPVDASEEDEAVASHVLLNGYLNSSILDYSGKTGWVVVRAEVRRGEDAIIGNVSVTASISSPLGQVTTLELLDNGLGADEVKFDGIYSRYLTKVEGGKEGDRYEVVVTAVVNDAGAGADARIRPIADLAADFTKMADYQKIYSFERQTTLGSIRVQGKFRKPVPRKVDDLRVVSVDMNNRTVELVWTAAGDEGDNGTAAGVEVQGSTGSEAAANWTLLTNVTGGSLETVPANERQNVELRVPDELWEKATNSTTTTIQLYFSVRTINSDSEFGQMSNLAPAAFALETTGENEDGGSGSPALTIVLIVLTCLASIAALVFGVHKYKKGNFYAAVAGRR